RFGRRTGYTRAEAFRAPLLKNGGQKTSAWAIGTTQEYSVVWRGSGQLVKDPDRERDIYLLPVYTYLLPPYTYLLPAYTYLLPAYRLLTEGCVWDIAKRYYHGHASGEICSETRPAARARWWTSVVLLLGFRRDASEFSHPRRCLCSHRAPRRSHHSGGDEGGATGRGHRFGRDRRGVHPGRNGPAFAGRGSLHLQSN